MARRRPSFSTTTIPCCSAASRVEEENSFSRKLTDAGSV
jgi:hypothetical protein